MQDMKMTDQVAWREIGGHEIARHEMQDVKMQDMKLQDMKLEDKQRKSSNRDYIRMQFLLLFSKHATVKCTRHDVYSLKNANAL